MKAFASLFWTVLLIGLFALLPSAVRADIIGSAGGTAAPAATLGGYTMTPFPADSSQVGLYVSSINSPLGETVGFSIPMLHFRIGQGWPNWSHGYTGDVYWTVDVTVMELTLPAQTKVFYFYAQPKPGGGTVTINAIAHGTTVSQVVEDSDGAKYYGFYADGESTIESIIISSSFTFAVGEFGIASAPVIPDVIQTTIDIDPHTLNLKSKGKWITCYIWLPEGYDVRDIDVTTIALKKDNFEVGGEYGEFQTGKLMVKFLRSEVQNILEPGEVELTVSGELDADGTKFEGTDIIRVINEGGKK